MEPVLLSTFFFIPNGEAEIVSIRFYLSDHHGIWDIDTNNVYLDHTLWSQWKDCKNDQLLQKKFFAGLKRISHMLLP